MKIFINFQVFILVFVISAFYEEEVAGQTIYPQYGGAPIVYDNSEDDDIGLLLTVLLLAARNRNGNCNCCNCCNCGNAAKNIPIPFPIPFPTNNAIINRAPPIYYDEDDNGDDNNDKGNNGNNGNDGNKDNDGKNGNNGNTDNNGGSKGDSDIKDKWTTIQIDPGVKYDKTVTFKLVPTPIETENDDSS